MFDGAELLASRRADTCIFVVDWYSLIKDSMRLDLYCPTVRSDKGSQMDLFSLLALFSRWEWHRLYVRKNTWHVAVWGNLLILGQAEYRPCV